LEFGVRMPLAEGSRLGPYVISVRIGAGGMGEVWRARDSRLGREVALKVLPDSFAADVERVARFRAEARAASLLNHPNVVTVFDVGQEEGRAWFAMELLEGETLRRLLDAGRPPLRRALQISTQIAEGLAAAHVKGIVHRDLKPENVFVTSDGLVKLLDFGLAKSSPLAASGTAAAVSTASLETAPGAFLGTVGYTSPEQVAGEPADFRSDQFSFGTILCELLTGERAWKKATSAETLVAILREEPPALTSVEAGLPAPLKRIVERCLAKDPAGRFASTRDLAGDLRYLLEHADELPAAPGPPPALHAPARTADRRTRFLLAATALTALIVVAAFVAVVLARSRPGARAVESVAVLPFENGTKEPSNDYLSDGLTEGLIDRLSRLAELRVMARATVFRFRNARDPQEAGRTLVVGAVVTGTVWRRGDRLVVSAEAIDVKTGARLWGNRYDRPFADLVRVEAEIATDVSGGLRLRLPEPEKRLLARRGTEDSEAFDLFMRGRHASLEETEEGYRKAIRFFLAAAKKDPGFAEAHLYAGAEWGHIVTEGYDRPAEGWARSDEGARRALELDPDLSDARSALAIRRAFFDWDFDGAEREFRELFAGPRPPVWGSRAFALLLWARGKTGEAIAVTDRARLLDPGNVADTMAAADYRAQVGQPGEAVGLYRAAIEAEPEDPRGYFGLAAILRGRGDAAGAIEYLRKAYERSGETEGVSALVGARTPEDYDAAQLKVAKARLAELTALARERYVSPLELARLAAMAGESDRAVTSLEAALAERSPGLIFLNVDRAWDGIRGDPRFASVRRRVGL